MELTDLIKSVDIVEYISQFVELTQKGDEWWGLSCFKSENTPSFSVRKDPPLFYDYSSGIGGNLFTFVKNYHKCSGFEAVNIIKRYAGMDEELAEAHEKMTATLDCKKFMRKKQEQKQQISTILPDNYMERYEKRLDKMAIWEKEGISQSAMDKFQVYYDGFSDRLVYPIRNVEGKIVNIGGRTLDPCWKEKNLRKYTYFKPWGRLDTIYGLYENMEDILRAHEVIIFEGCKSVLIANTWGIQNCAAILTSHLNPYQMKILARLGCRVVFALDKEVNVRNDYNISRLKDYINVEYICDKDGLLDEKDSPVDKGLEVFQAVYSKRLRFR